MKKENFLKILSEYDQKYFKDFKIIQQDYFTSSKSKFLKNNTLFIEEIKEYLQKIINVRFLKKLIIIEVQLNEKIKIKIKIHFFDYFNSTPKEIVSNCFNFDNKKYIPSKCFNNVRDLYLKPIDKTIKNIFNEKEIFYLLRLYNLTYIEQNFHISTNYENLIFHPNFTNFLLYLKYHNTFGVENYLLLAITKKDKNSPISKLTIDSLRVICQL